MKRAYVESNESGPPTNLQEFRQWLDEMEAKCPTEFRDEIIIGWNDEEGIYCGYSRPETDEEAAEREAWEKQPGYECEVVYLRHPTALKVDLIKKAEEFYALAENTLNG